MGGSPSTLATQVFEAATVGDDKGFIEALDALCKKSDHSGKNRGEVGALIRDASVDPRFKGDTVLHAACRFTKPMKSLDSMQAKLSIVKEILSWRTIDITEKTPTSGRTALHWVCDCGLLPDFPTAIVNLLLEEGAICSGDDKLTIDANGFDPLMLAAKWGFTDGVKELVGCGARVGPVDHKFKKNALHYAFPQDPQLKGVGFEKLLQSLLAVADQQARAAVGFSENGWPETPFMTALFACRYMSSWAKDGGVKVMNYLLKNGINFFEECMSYQVYMTNVGYLKEEHLDKQENKFDGWRDFGRVIYANRNLITPEIIELFFAENELTKQAHPYPWKPCFLFSNEKWNTTEVEESPLLEFGKASPLAGAIMLMRFEVFKLLVQENGFGMLLKPIESKIVVPTSSSPSKNNNNDEPEAVLRVVPLYILAAAFVPDETATEFLRVAFESADPGSLKDFSAFRSYAGENMSELLKLGDENRLRQFDDEALKYSTYDYFYLRDPAMTYIFNKNDLELSNKHKTNFIIHNGRCFHFFYYSASHIQQHVKNVTFFALVPTNQNFIKKFLSVFHNVESIHLLSASVQSDDEFDTIANYTNANGTGIRQLLMSTTDEETQKDPDRSHVTSRQLNKIVTSPILQQSLKTILIPVCKELFALAPAQLAPVPNSNSNHEAEAGDKLLAAPPAPPQIPWFKQLVYSLPALDVITFSDCTDLKQKTELDEFNAAIQSGEFVLPSGKTPLVRHQGF